MPWGVRVSSVWAACVLGLGVGVGLAGCGRDEAQGSGGGRTASAAADGLVVGAWELDPETYSNSAFNALARQAEKQGFFVTDAQLERRIPEMLRRLRSSPPVTYFRAGGEIVVETEHRRSVGTWDVEGSTVTVFIEGREEPNLYRLEGGVLSTIVGEKRRRVVRLLKKRGAGEESLRVGETGKEKGSGGEEGEG